jgi:hypothetical protein
MYSEVKRRDKNLKQKTEKRDRKLKIKDAKPSLELKYAALTKCMEHFNKLYRAELEFPILSIQRKIRTWHFDTFKINWNDILDGF